MLPFVNMSGDPQQEYFSDGLAEELLNSLVRVSELKVAARASTRIEFCVFAQPRPEADTDRF
jgi:TolB-like protein